MSINAITKELGIKSKGELWKLWGAHGSKIKTKFININGKTGRYSVPALLFQKRTARYNRVLLPWKVAYANNLTIDKLETFYGGLCVEFVNEDFLNPKYENNETFKILKRLLGSDGMISSMISFRTEDGDSGAAIPRSSFEEFRKFYKDDFDKQFQPIKRKRLENIPGKGDNSVWEGNIYYSIKGGSQKGEDSHGSLGEQALFNPATEYANEDVCLDINLTLSYFAMHCFDLNKNKIQDFGKLKIQVEEYLKMRTYDEGNLYEYCTNHPSLNILKGVLVDPIQVTKISIYDFEKKRTELKKEEEFEDKYIEKNNIEAGHNEAATLNRFYFDSIQQCILSPARPTNLFWSTHWSNMMQQNYTLDEYFQEEATRTRLRESYSSTKY